MSRFIIYFLVYFLSISLFGNYFKFILTFPTFIVIILAVSQIRSSYFSMLDMLWLVIFIYFVLAPIQNIVGNVMPFGPTQNIEFSDRMFILTSLNVFIFAISLFITLFVGKGFSVDEGKGRSEISVVKVNHIKSIILFLLFVVGVFLYVKSTGSIENLLKSRLEKDIDEVVEYSFIPIALTSVSFTIFAKLIKDRLFSTMFTSRIIFISMIIICITVFNPFNTSRYFLLSIWLPIIFIMFKERLKVKLIYIVMFLGVTVVMPVLSVTTRRGLDGLDIIELFNSGYLGGLRGLDIYDMALYSLVHAQSFEFEYGLGHYLLPIFFFFIPRSIWPSKPQPFSVEVSDNLVYVGYAGTNNLSLPFFMDGYADFHIIGTALMGVLFGVFINKLLKNRCFISDVLILSFMAYLPIIIRGPFNGITGLVFFQFVFFFIISILIDSKKKF